MQTAMVRQLGAEAALGAVFGIVVAVVVRGGAVGAVRFTPPDAGWLRHRPGFGVSFCTWDRSMDPPPVVGAAKPNGAMI